MKSTTALVLLGLSVGIAHAGPRSAIDSVRDAVDRVSDEGGRCKRELFDDLREVEDLILDKDYSRARRRIKGLEDDARVCPRSVRRLLADARKALETDRDRDRYRDRDDDTYRDRDRDSYRDTIVVPSHPVKVQPVKPQRANGVPYADWPADCKSLWLIMEIARNNTDEGTLNQLFTLATSACQNNGLAATSWPSGLTAKADNGTFYYPNGLTAKSSNGTYYYPNGLTAMASNGTWYYPSGLTAYASNGTWYYANGLQAGGYELLVSDACSRSGAAACAKYKKALNSDIQEWRTYAIVQLVASAPH